MIQVVNHTRGTVLGARIAIADGFWWRLRGLLLSPEPRPGQGLLLSPCQAVHMFFMRFPLDVVFLDDQGVVVAMHPELRPWRWTPVHRSATHALELPAGTLRATATERGDRLSWTAATSEEPADAAGVSRTRGRSRNRAEGVA